MKEAVEDTPKAHPLEVSSDPTLLLCAIVASVTSTSLLALQKDHLNSFDATYLSVGALVEAAVAGALIGNNKSILQTAHILYGLYLITGCMFAQNIYVVGLITLIIMAGSYFHFVMGDYCPFRSHSERIPCSIKSLYLGCIRTNMLYGMCVTALGTRFLMCMASKA